MKTFKEFTEEEIVVEATNYSKVDFGDVYGIIQDAMEVTVGGAPRGKGIELVVGELIQYYAKSTIETWDDNNMEIDDDVRSNMESFASGVKVKIKT